MELHGAKLLRGTSVGVLAHVCGFTNLRDEVVDSGAGPAESSAGGAFMGGSRQEWPVASAIPKSSTWLC